MTIKPNSPLLINKIYKRSQQVANGKSEQNNYNPTTNFIAKTKTKTTSATVITFAI